MKNDSQFKTAHELLGKVVRRVAPSKNGDFSFINECALIKEIRENAIIMKTLEGHIVSLSRENYDDDNWIHTNGSVSSTVVAGIWAQVRNLTDEVDSLKSVLASEMVDYAETVDNLCKECKLESIQDIPKELERLREIEFMYKGLCK